jgi:hypothetical protein
MGLSGQQDCRISPQQVYGATNPFSSGQGVFCDLPQVPPGPSGKFVIAIMAAQTWKALTLLTSNCRLEAGRAAVGS